MIPLARIQSDFRRGLANNDPHEVIGSLLDHIAALTKRLEAAEAYAELVDVVLGVLGESDSAGVVDEKEMRRVEHEKAVNDAHN